MAPHKITLKLDNQETNVDLPNLESLLRQSLDDNTLQVVEHKATTLLPPGENYCSIIIKLDVVVRRHGSEKFLQLVAKTPSTKEQNNVDWPLLFKKELFMYTEMSLLYRELEKESGISEHELINVWPGYVGYRNSLNGGDDIDENSLLLMENIKAKGFNVMDRKKGLDIHHASKALTLLARYHALGIVMQQRRPSFAKKAIEQARVLGLDFVLLDEGYDSVLKGILKTPCLQKHLDVVKSSFERARGGNLYKTVPSETWASITHGDFWVNNMLFRKDAAGNVEEVKFVDFQMYLYDSALRDLPYFFTGSLDETTQANHLQELIDIYYNRFIDTLSHMGCDFSPFTRESFVCELKKQAIDMLPLCLLATKFFVHEVDNDSNDNGKKLIDAVFDAETSDLFADKLKGFTEMYEKMAWF